MIRRKCSRALLTISKIIKECYSSSMSISKNVYFADVVTQGAILEEELEEEEATSYRFCSVLYVSAVICLKVLGLIVFQDTKHQFVSYNIACRQSYHSDT